MEYSESFDKQIKIDRSILILTQKERKMLRSVVEDCLGFLDSFPTENRSEKYIFLQDLLEVL